MNEQKSNQNRRFTTWLTWLGGLCCLMLLSVSGADAQQWEWVYGDQPVAETGNLRVVPVTGLCATPSGSTSTDGYIAVGIHDGDAYVVRTDNNGAKIWEETYDVTGNGHADQANSIIELSDGSGFAITGTILYNNGWQPDPFIMKIDCNSVVLWSRTYGISTTYEEAMDIVEARSGDPAFGTAAGDLIICGSTNRGNQFGAQRGLIIRVSPAGFTLWQQRYDGNGNHVRLRALTDLTAGTFANSPTGDIIAVGEEFPQIGGAFWAYAVRVNGNTGAIGAAPQGASLYPNVRIGSRFNSVEELANPAERNPATGYRNVVMAGTFRNYMYFVKLVDGDPCLPSVQKKTGGNGLAKFAEATTIREIRHASPYVAGAQQWDLAVSGYERDNAAVSQETQAVLVVLNPTTLRPWRIAHSYGSQNLNENEEAWSVAPVDDIGGRTWGFILCGTTDTDWTGDADVGDMYLVKTDHLGKSGCEKTFDSTTVDTSTNTCQFNIARSLVGSLSWTASQTSRDWGDQVCGSAPKRSIHFAQEASGSLDIAYSIDAAIREFGNHEFSATNPRYVLLDVAGRKVATGEWQSIQDDGYRNSVLTALPKGSFFLMFEDGENSVRYRITNQ